MYEQTYSAFYSRLRIFLNPLAYVVLGGVFLFKKLIKVSFIIVLFLCAFLVFCKNAEFFKNGIEISLQEDFKIKETLGQVFFLDKEKEDIKVSSSVQITSISLPCKGEIEQKEILGEKCIVIHSKKFESVKASNDGIIETVGNDRIAIRHYDGKLSHYYGAVCLLKKGESVKKGESIGYAKGNITFKLYENCVALNPMEYLS